MKKYILVVAALLTFVTSSVSVEAIDFNKLKNEIKKEVKSEIKKEIKSYVDKKLNEFLTDSKTHQPSQEKLVYTDFSQSHIEYSSLDDLNRAGQATAYLTKDNVTKSVESRGGQRFTPSGFQKQAKIWDRGHLIAYSLTYNLDDNGNYSKGHDGSLDNPLNLFTQTSQSNRGKMKDLENDVRDVLKTGEKVIYRVTPVYYENELVARHVKVEAVSEYGTLTINEIVDNVQDGMIIDYSTGRVKSK